MIDVAMDELHRFGAILSAVPPERRSDFVEVCLVLFESGQERAFLQAAAHEMTVADVADAAKRTIELHRRVRQALGSG